MKIARLSGYLDGGSQLHDGFERVMVTGDTAPRQRLLLVLLGPTTDQLFDDPVQRHRSRARVLMVSHGQD